MTRAIDRWFLRYRRTGDVRLLGNVFDRAAPELWRFAAHLCADRHDAEDAVQTAFLAAIENRDDWDEERPLVPWLLGVLANRVREQRRREGRVVDAARTEARAPVPDPLAVAAQRELDARLAASLQALGEPYTSTLQRHLFEGLAAVDLAHELGVPAGTVRMRLHRGLERLRELLPAGLGTTAMASVVVPLVLTDSAKAAMREQVLAKAVALGGTARVGSVIAWPWLLAALLPIVLVGAMWALVPAGFGASTPVVASGDPIVGTQEPATVATLVSPEAGAASLTPPIDGERRRAELPSTASVPAGRLRVTVVHAGTEEPLVGVRVTATCERARAATADETASTTSADPERRIFFGGGQESSPGVANSAPLHAAGQTDDEGHVDLRIAAGPVRVTATIGTSVSSRVEVVAGAVTEHVHVVPVQFTADVLVVAPDGSPCIGAIVLGRSDSGDFRPVGLTDSEGRWSSPCIDLQLQVRAVLDGCAASRVALVRRKQEQVRLTLDGPAARLRGVVRDADGAILPEARIVLWQNGTTFDPFELRADATGTFDCPWLAPGRYQWLAGDAARRLAPGLGELDLAFGMAAVEFRTTRGARIMVRSQRHDGSAISGMSVLAESTREDLPDQVDAWRTRHGVLAGSGCCELSGVIAGTTRVVAEWAGKDYAETIDVADGAMGTVTFDCLEGAKLAIEVVDEDGIVRPGVGVALRSRGHVRQVQTTDAHGRVTFFGVAGGQHDVAIGPAGMKGLAWACHSVSTGPVQRLVVPRSTGTARLRGRLVGEGLDGELWVQCLRGEMGSDSIEQARGTLDAATGSFVIDSLPAGSMHLMVLAPASVQVLALRTVDLSRGGDVDLGTIACGSGELIVRVHGEGQLRTPRAGAGMFSRYGLMPMTSDGVWKQPLPEGTWQVLAWAENAQPSIVSAVVENGASTELEVHLVPGTPTTFSLVLDRPVLEFTLADGRQFGCVVAQAKSVTLGLPPGRHQLVNRSLNGEGAATAFDVGSEPGTVDLTKLPTTR